MPAAVVLCEGELRLPLDLDRRLHRAVLRARLSRTPQIELHEAPGPDDLAWIGRAHEFLLPLRLASRAIDTHRQAPGPPRPIAQDASQLPGASAWLHAQIPGHPDRQDEILAGHLPRLFEDWDDPPLWWFSRHREMTLPHGEQHLNLYLRLATPAEYGPAAARVGQWAAGLRERNLVPGLRLATYHPETGRFGHGDAITAAEEVFATDSAATLAQITTAARNGIPGQALTAASLADLASSFAPAPAQGLRWLLDVLPHQPARPERSLRDTALELAGPAGGRQALCALQGGEEVAAAWDRRGAALATYRACLTGQKDPCSALRSLLHLHHVRSMGMDPERERVSNRLARAVALRQLALTALETR